MSWAFKSQQLMFPLRAQMEESGNRAMMQGGLQHGQNAQQAMHEMSSMHLKQQAFDQQVFRETQLQATRNASLDLRAKNIGVRAQALQFDREQKLFDREFAERKEKQKFWGRKWGNDKDGWWLFGPTNEAMRYQTEEEREKAWEGFFPDMHNEKRKADNAVDRAATYRYRAETAEGRLELSRKESEYRRLRGEAMEDLRRLTLEETKRSNLSKESHAKERNRILDKYQAAGGTGGEFARAYKEMQAEKMRADATSKILDDARKDLESLGESMSVPGFPIAVGEDAKYPVHHKYSAGKPVYSKEKLDAYAKKRKEIEDRRDLSLGRLHPKKGK